VLLFHHPVLVLAFKQRLYLSLARWFLSITSVFFLLSFSGSCLVSSFLSEVRQFEFVHCPQVLENSSVAHQPSCFGVRFSLCWFIGGLFLRFTSFLLDKVRDSSAGSLLSACYDGLLIGFQFCSIVSLWCCSMAQEMSFVDLYMLYFRQWLITCLL
jgi:hypothetical protein